MQEAKTAICNQKGLHARAASRFARESSKFNAEIRVSLGGNIADGNSIMGLMLLTASIGSNITITAEGPEEKQAIAALVSLVEKGFYEDE